MKILFYINQLGEGGAERAISNTASYFAEHGWDTILLTSFRVGQEYDYSGQICRMSIENEQVVQPRWKRNWSRIKALRQICRQEMVDVVVSFMGEPSFRTVIAAAGLKVKTIVSIRSDPGIDYRGIIQKIMGKCLLPCADGAVFQTQDAKSWFPKRMQSRSAVIYNVVNDKFYRTQYQGGMDIVTFGRISPEKNQKLLIRAFQKIHGRFPDVHLCIYGSGEVDLGLLELIERLGVQNVVFLMGKCDQVPEILSKARLFVLSSDYEGMPNALMEAMAVGVPSISTDCSCGGPRELFGEELKDMLVPVRDEGALADKMAELLSNEEKRLETGRMMRKRAEQFRTDIIGQQWAEYVELVLHRGWNFRQIKIICRRDES